MTDKELILEALLAQKASHAPVSNFHVGAALLGKNGTVYRGCNIEISGLSSSICAERTAFFKAVSSEVKEFEAIVIVGGREGQPEYCSPCGICRQVMTDFCDVDTFRVILAKTEEDYQVYTLGELLPHHFKMQALR